MSAPGQRISAIELSTHGVGDILAFSNPTTVGPHRAVDDLLDGMVSAGMIVFNLEPYIEAAGVFVCLTTPLGRIALLLAKCNCALGRLLRNVVRPDSVVSRLAYQVTPLPVNGFTRR